MKTNRQIDNFKVRKVKTSWKKENKESMTSDTSEASETNYTN
jgi:hypothetical protein